MGLRDKLSPMFALEFERDTEAGLALRGGLSLNVEKRLLDSDVQSLDAAIGLGASVARYDADLAYSANGLLETRLRYPDEKATERLQLRLRARYAHAILRNGSFEEAITLYPNLTDAGEFRARSESSVLFPITPRLHVKLDLLVDFDSDPEFERLDEWRTSVGASLLWRF